jgi:PadR family transcriptional regulator, regulatory protein PadR
MPFRTCPRHGNEHPCTCAMGNVYRFVEPVALFLLEKKGRTYGYDLAADVRKHALTDAEIEVSALYRTLRQLEQNACVTSQWDVEGNGPARRLYELTPRGREHLQEWLAVLAHLSESMSKFVREARSQFDPAVTKKGIKPHRGAVPPRVARGAKPAHARAEGISSPASLAANNRRTGE